MNLSEIFAMVEVTTGQGIQVLSSLAKENADQDPAFMATIHEAIAQLSSMPPGGPVTADAPAETTPTYSS